MRRTVNMQRFPRHELAQLTREYPPDEQFEDRPRTRGECSSGVRPCPYAACRFNLYLDVLQNGSIQFNFPNKEIDEVTDTCALDIADRGGVTLQEVGDTMNLTRERVRQIEREALRKVNKRRRLSLI